MSPKERLEHALARPDHGVAVLELANTLRDQGVSQEDLYELLTQAFVATDRDDGRYDTLADTMDRVLGGPWAKGQDLY